MNNIPGFASAQRAWENMEPKDSGCDCPPLYKCQRCDGVTTEPYEGNQCDDEACRADAAGDASEGLDHFPAIVEAIDREDNDHDAVSSCPQHGFCTGCTSRNCEDCGGDDWEDR